MSKYPLSLLIADEMQEKLEFVAASDDGSMEPEEYAANLLKEAIESRYRAYQLKFVTELAADGLSEEEKARLEYEKCVFCSRSMKDGSPFTLMLENEVPVCTECAAKALDYFREDDFKEMLTGKAES